MKKNIILVTGGAGFIGSALIRHIISYSDYKVINIDKLTYSGNLESLKSIEGNQNYTCLLYTSPSPRDKRQSRMPSSA